jgi:hypothetical protein
MHAASFSFHQPHYLVSERERKMREFGGLLQQKDSLVGWRASGAARKSSAIILACI